MNVMGIFSYFNIGVDISLSVEYRFSTLLAKTLYYLCSFTVAKYEQVIEYLSWLIIAFMEYAGVKWYIPGFAKYHIRYIINIINRTLLLSTHINLFSFWKQF